MQRRRFLVPVAFFASAVALSAFSGCKSSCLSGLSNSLTTDRQTVAPPATFSHQQAYLGQTSGSYVPQSPATVYGPTAPVTTPPTAIPPNVPLPSSSTVPTTYGTGDSGGYGSLDPSGATLFHTSSSNPSLAASTSESGWAPSANPAPVAVGADIPAAYTQDTAFRNLETQLHTTTTVAADGTVSKSYTAPESLVVSSSQIITRIGEERMPEALTAEPKSLYASEYQ